MFLKSVKKSAVREVKFAPLPESARIMRQKVHELSQIVPRPYALVVAYQQFRSAFELPQICECLD